VPVGMVYSINPFMIIFLVPVVGALTTHANHFDMVHYGGYVSALAPFWMVAFNKGAAHGRYMVSSPSPLYMVYACGCHRLYRDGDTTTPYLVPCTPKRPLHVSTPAHGCYGTNRIAYRAIYTQHRHKSCGHQADELPCSGGRVGDSAVRGVCVAGRGHLEPEVVRLQHVCRAGGTCHLTSRAASD